MTQPPVRPIFYPMDKETEEEFSEMVLERWEKYTKDKFQWYNDTFGGFWKQPPARRLATYEAAEPVFDPNIPEAMLETFLEQGVWEPLEPVYDMVGNVKPPQPAVDPMTGQPSVDQMGQPAMQPALLGTAPVILGPWWRKMWAVNRDETLDMLRDYRDIQRRRAE